MDLPAIDRTEEPTRAPAPPELPYFIHDRTGLRMMLLWIFILLDLCILPISLFYSLWFGTDLGHYIIFAITTSSSGVFTGIKNVLRLYQLVKKDSSCRPLDSKRIWLDFFQIIFSIGLITITIELVIGTVPHEPLVRLLAMPVPSLVFVYGIPLATSAILYAVGARAPVRISSIAQGAPMRPGLYIMLEDVGAVDGHCGRAYREAINARYEASYLFRRMLGRLTMFWGISAVVIAGAITAVIFTAPVTVAYGVGWAGPFLWAAIWALITVRWVRQSLREEKSAWLKESMYPAA